jgi:hypothetical protein
MAAEYIGRSGVPVGTSATFGGWRDIKYGGIVVRGGWVWRIQRGPIRWAVAGELVRTVSEPHWDGSSPASLRIRSSLGKLLQNAANFGFGTRVAWGPQGVDLSW